MKLCLYKSSGLLLVLLLLAKATIAQHGREMITVSTSTTDITSLAKSISAQTGLKYSLNMQNTSMRKKITIRPGNYQLAQVLEQIKKQAALQYKIVGTHILFIDYSAVQSQKSKIEIQHSKVTTQKPTTNVTKRQPSLTTKSSTVKKQSSHTIKPVIPRQQTGLSKPVPTGNIVTSSITKAALLPGNSSPAAIARLLIADTIHAAQTLSPVKKMAEPTTASTTAAPVPPAAKRERNNKWLQPAIRAGLTSDELFYAGAQVTAGLQWLYGIAYYGTDFNSRNFRWGGGVSLPVGEKQRLHLNFTTGNASNYYPIDSIYKKEVWVKEKLHRLGVSWSNNFSNRLSIQVQLHYNMLKQSFSADTSGVATDTPFRDNFDERYRVFKPPYTIYKSVNTTSASKGWLGLQVSLFYIFL